jgi:WD40 repeat protein
MRRLLFALPLFVLAIGNTTATADPKNPTYDDDVVAIFKQHCTSCHGNDKQKSDLNLATYAALKQGGSSGEVMVPGDPDKSRLFALTAHKEEPKMPPNKDRIPDAQLSLLKLWIEQGGRENSGSKAIVPKKTTEIALASIVKGRPEGPPPMPVLGKLPLDPVVVARRPGSILALAASPWAPVVAVGGQKQVLLYNSDTAQLVGVIPFEHGQINSIKFSRNAQYLLVAGGVGGQSGKAVLHEIKTGKKIVEVGIESDAILAADISADQTQIAVGSPSKLVRIYSTKDGSVLREIKKHTDWVTAVEFSPDGVLLATGDRNGGLFAWEAFTGREFFSLRGHTGMISDLSWRDDSNVLASSSEDGNIKIRSMQNGNAIKSWGAHKDGASGVWFTHDNKLATTGRDKVTKLWDQDGKVQKQFEAFPDLGLSVAVTHDNSKIIAGDWSGIVKAFNAADAKVIAEFDANPPPLTDRVKTAEAAIPAADARVAEA